MKYFCYISVVCKAKFKRIYERQEYLFDFEGAAQMGEGSHSVTCMWKCGGCSHQVSHYIQVFLMHFDT